MALESDCGHCGPEVREDCEECGRGWVREDYALCIIGNIVVSLFPSLDSVTTGKIIGGEVVRPTMREEGFNVGLGLKYISMNGKYTSDIQPLIGIMPTRLTKPEV